MNDYIFEDTFVVEDEDEKLIDTAYVDVKVKKFDIKYVAVSDGLVEDEEVYKALISDAEAVVRDRDIDCFVYDASKRGERGIGDITKAIFVKIGSFISVSLSGVYKVNNGGTFILINSGGVSIVDLPAEACISMKDGDMYHHH